MLAEAVQFAATLAVSRGCSLDALRDSVGLWSRARRCRDAWREHEQLSQAAMHRAIDSLAQRRCVAVLGSGLLRDVPIERLVTDFQSVLLIDLCHLATVRWACRKWPNVTFETRDLSGFDKLVERRRISLSTGQDHIGGQLDPLAFLRRIADLDLVISANLLSQVAEGAEARLARGGRDARVLPEDAVARLVGAHLDSLARLQATTCLVTDVSFVRRNRAGLVVEQFDLMRGVPISHADANWTWTVAPFGEEDPDFERVHNVIALQDYAIDLDGFGHPD